MKAKYIITKPTTVLYDNYSRGFYSSSSSVTYKANTEITAEPITQGTEKKLSFYDNVLNEQVQIPAENAKRKLPKGLIISLLLLILAGAFALYNKYKK